MNNLYDYPRIPITCEKYHTLQLDNYEVNLKHNELLNISQSSYMCVWCGVDDNSNNLLCIKYFII